MWWSDPAIAIEATSCITNPQANKVRINTASLRECHVGSVAKLKRDCAQVIRSFKTRCIECILLELVQLIDGANEHNKMPLHQTKCMNEPLDNCLHNKQLKQQSDLCRHSRNLCYCLLRPRVNPRGRKKTVELSVYKIQDETFGFLILVAHPAFAFWLLIIAEHVQRTIFPV